MKNHTNAHHEIERGDLPQMMERRRFLVLGSAAVVGTAALDLPAQILRTAWGPAQALPLLSAGYLDGNVATSRTFVAATALRSGDASLAGSQLELRVLDFARAVATPEPVSIGLNALYRAGERKVPHLAWSYSTAAKSRGARFVVPVDHASPLELMLLRRTANIVTTAPVATPADFVVDFPETADGDLAMTEGNGRSIAAFSLGRERTAMKLRSGVYALAFRTSAEQRTPDWRSIQFVTPREGASPVLAEATLAGVRPVSFDYLVLSIERA